MSQRFAGFRKSLSESPFSVPQSTAKISWEKNTRPHISPPIAWVGCKRNILPEIVSRFPARYSRCIEVFGGNGVVLFGKKPVPLRGVEWLQQDWAGY